MRTLTIKEIHELSLGEIIPAFEGKVIKVYDQKTGVSDYGPWYLQNLIVEDDTGHVQVTWGGEDAFDGGAEGTLYRFESSETKKHGLQGVKWEVRNVNGKRYEGVKLTATCKIKRLDTSNGDEHRVEAIEESSGGSTYQLPKMNEGRRTHEVSEQKDMTPDGALEAKRHLVKSANLYNLCVDSVRTIVETHAAQFWPDGLGGEMFRTAVSSLYIEATRAGMLAKMPEKPL